MSSLREIRKRLHSIKNIQQLTKAMEMVAASHLHHAQQKTKHILIYLSKIKAAINDLRVLLTGFSHPLLEARKVKKTGVIIIAADMGLCGSYNKDVFTAANQFLNNYSPDQVELILMGHKAVEYYNRRNWTIRYEIPHIRDVISPMEIKTLATLFIDWFWTGELDEIWCVYTHYMTMLSREVFIEKFLNIEIPEYSEKVLIDYIFEPTSTEVYIGILLRYCFAKVQSFLQEAYACELAARVFAMKAATKNAEDMIEKLTLIRNKVRQSDITKEMLEITSGAESLK